MNILDYTGTKFINSPINLPTLAGNSGEKGKAGAIVKIYVGEKLFTVPVDPQTGLFTWTATEPFPDGDYSVSIVTVDRAGNVGTPILRTLRIDTTPPEAPELLNLYDDQGGKQSSFDPGQTTDDKRPKLTGIAQEGTLVYLRDADGNTIGSARADEVTGKWVMDPDKDLEEGVNNLVLVAEETFGGVTREGAPSASFKIIIGADSGILPPNTITITQAIDDAGSATGVLSNGALTDDTTPTLNGVVSAGSTVTVYYRLAGSNIWAGSATATVTGENWTWTPGSALATGTYEFQADIGDKSSALCSLEIATADEIALRTRVESAYDDFGLDQGPLANGAITDDATPGLRGRAEANSTVIVRYMLEGGSAASVTVNADSAGNWKWTPAAELQIGTWTFDVQAQGRSEWSSKFKLEITGSGENSFAPVIDYAVDDVGTSMGERKSGATTDDTTPTLHGKAAANSVVYLQLTKDGASEVFSVKTDSSSHWEWTPSTALTYGDWDFQVSNAATGNWGKVFDLKITSTGNSGSADFDDFFKDSNIISYNRDYYVDDKIAIAASGTTPKKHLDIVDPKTYGADTLGDRALEIVRNTGAHIYARDDKNIKNLISDYTVEIYNPLLTDYKIRGLAEYQTNFEYFEIILKPGLNILHRHDIDPSYSTIEVISHAWFYNDVNNGTNFTPVLFDNFSWETYGSLNPSSIAYQNDDLPNPTDNLVYNDNIHNTLNLNGENQVIDLSIDYKTDSIEIFNITGTGDNTLKLDLTALLQHGEKDLFIEDGKTQLVVNGNEGDVVQLVDILPEGSDISEWQHQEGTVTVAGVEYNVYSHDDAELLVQQGVKTELI